MCVTGEAVQNLIKEAIDARKRSYSPYSNFKVGAAILTEDDSKVFSGCNVESATFTPTLCAERAAIPKAVGEGYLKFKMIAVVAHQNEYTAPCGVCRQMLSEFRGTDGDMEVYLSRPTMDQVLCTKLSHLLPLAYVSYKIDSIIT